ncbi:MAG: hypothetical protein ABI647_22870, partial [Gemmatimonadota bacterium]
RTDQGAGFLLAGIKSALVVAFLVASLNKYATKWAQSVPWADEQVRTSMAVAWERHTRQNDGSVRWRRFVSADTWTGYVDWTTGRANREDGPPTGDERRRPGHRRSRARNPYHRPRRLPGHGRRLS